MYRRNDVQDDAFSEHTLIINSLNPVVKKLLTLNENTENKEKVNKLVNNIYDLALLSQNNLKGDRLINFIKRSNDLMGEVE